MKLNARALRALAIAGTIGLISPAAAQTTVTLDQGTVTGLDRADGTTVFYGILYADPPTGLNRWKPPVTPPSAFDGGALDASSSSRTVACSQAPNLLLKTGIPTSEDCLRVYITAPSAPASGPLPVMVWLHGGGFTVGTGADPAFDGKVYAQKGIIVVSVNYRLGAFGFLAHPELTAEDGTASGNYGLQDQIAALQWVKNNIAAFGGDPANVTLFGESAGATSIGYFLIAKDGNGEFLAGPNGLFQRAILESFAGGFIDEASGQTANGDLRSGESLGLEFAAGQSIETLRTKTAAEILALDDAEQSRLTPSDQRINDVTVKNGLFLGAASEKHQGLFGKNNPWWISLDGKTIPAKGLRAAFNAGEFAKIPVLLGTNVSEGDLFTILARVGLTALGYQGNFEQYLTDYYAPISASLLPLFKKDGPCDGVPCGSYGEAASRLITDAQFLYGTKRLADFMSQDAPESTYLYRFDYANAFHGQDVDYVFGFQNAKTSPSAEQLQVSSTLISSWAQFAATGNPNGGDLPQWPAYTADSPSYRIFNKQVSTGSDLPLTILNLIQQNYERDFPADGPGSEVRQASR